MFLSAYAFLSHRTLTKSPSKDRSVHEKPWKTFLVTLDITLLPLNDDISGLDPLTPNHILIVTQSLYINPNIKWEKIDSKLRWKAVQVLLKIFWDLFVKEYLPPLQI